jgi:hypothetical protein
LTDEHPLGVTILSAAGTTAVPRKVKEALKLGPTLHKREKILWTQEGDEVIVSRGTPQSSFRKTMLRRDGRAAVPKHIKEALNLNSTPREEERMAWIQKGDKIVVRKGASWSSPTD